MGIARPRRARGRRRGPARALALRAAQPRVSAARSLSTVPPWRRNQSRRPEEEIYYPDPLDLERLIGEDPDGKAAWILLETYRWTVLHGEAPYDKVWDNREGYPSTRDVVAAFGSWENLWELAGLYDSYHLRALDAADEEYEQVLEERKALREDRQKAQREAARARKEAERLEDRLREMRRQVEKAKEKAEGATDALSAERARAERAERRVQEAERAVAQRPAAAPRPARPTAAGTPSARPSCSRSSTARSASPTRSPTSCTRPTTE